MSERRPRNSRLHRNCWSFGASPDILVRRHDARSPYLEEFWLAALGPTCTVILRHLADSLRRNGSFGISLKELPHHFGLGSGYGRNSALRPQHVSLDHIRDGGVAEPVNGFRQDRRAMAHRVTGRPSAPLAPDVSPLLGQERRQFALNHSKENNHAISYIDHSRRARSTGCCRPHASDGERLQVSFAIHVVTSLGMSDLLANGPQAVAELATATRTHEPTLLRLLRALASVGVYERDDGGSAPRSWATSSGRTTPVRSRRGLR
jgi:hypothetical protein